MEEIIAAESRKTLSEIPVNLIDLLTQNHPVFLGKSIFIKGNRKKIAEHIYKNKKGVKTFNKHNSFETTYQSVVRMFSAKDELTERIMKDLRFLINLKLEKLPLNNIDLQNAKTLIWISLAKHQEIFHYLEKNPDLKFKEVISVFYPDVKDNLDNDINFEPKADSDTGTYTSDQFIAAVGLVKTFKGDFIKPIEVSSLLEELKKIIK